MNGQAPGPQKPGFSADHYAGQSFTSMQVDAQLVKAIEFLDCTFRSCTFVETVFQDCRFSDCRFHECDLSMARMPGTLFTSTIFEDSKLVGINWVTADWPAHPLGEPLQFKRCAISHSTFLGLPLQEMVFRDCMAVDVDFRGADLTGAEFLGTDLSESLFLKTDLSRANLTTARNYHIVPGENVLTGARFTLPEALSLLYNLDITLEE